MQAVALLGDVCRKAGAVGGGQVVLQEFGAGGDGGERAFQFVGEGFDVAGDVVAVFEFAPHVADGIRQAVQFGGEVEARRRRDRRVGGSVTTNQVDAAPYPQGKQGDEGEADGEVERTAATQFVLGLCLVGLDVGAGFAEADDTEQAAVAVTDGGSDIHGAAVCTVAAACTVFAAQGAQDVVPAAVVFAGFKRVAVVEDDAVGIGDDELLVVRGFVVLVDVDVAWAGEVGAQGGLPGGVADVAVLQGGSEAGGEDLCVVGEGIFQHLPHAGAQLLLYVAHEQCPAQGENKPIDEEEADKDGHCRVGGVSSDAIWLRK